MALGVSICLLGYVMWSSGDIRFGTKSLESRPVTARGELADSERTIIEIFETASRSVVNVSQFRARVNSWLNTEEPYLSDAGTGFVWDTQGHIVTNFHVILDPGAPPAELRIFDDLRVIMPDGDAHPAAIVGYSRDKDLAVLKVDVPANRLQPLALGTSADLQVGQTVLAIGNPFGLDQTLTVGVVSALNRSIRSPSDHRIDGVIQTDAAINPGNSGGPLLDSAGRLVGVNTMIYSRSGSSSGIGFAVPVDVVTVVVPELIAYGRVVRPGLGVVLDPDDTNVLQFGLEGAHVLRAWPESTAERAGLLGLHRLQNRLVRGDVIQALGEQRIRSRADLLDALLTHQVGDTLSMTVDRFGVGKLELEVTLQALD